MYAFFESSKQYFLESVNGISWKSEIGISLAQNQKPHEINHAVFDKKTKPPSSESLRLINSRRNIMYMLETWVHSLF